MWCRDIQHQLWCSRTSTLKAEAVATGKLSSEKLPWEDLHCSQKPQGEPEQSSRLAHASTFQPGIQATSTDSGDTCTSWTMSSDGNIPHADTIYISQLTQVGALALDLPLSSCHSPLLTQLSCLPEWLTGLAPELTGTANQGWLRNTLSLPEG